MKNKELNALALLVVALVLALAACVPAPTSQPVAALTATQTPTPVPPTSTPMPPTPTRVPPTSTPKPEITLDADALKNLTYRSEWTASGTAPLTDGEYSEAAAPGSATKTVIQLHDLMALGNTADGQPLAAVILVTSPGGSGTFYDLAAVTVRDGELAHVATAHLGDRVQIESLAIENGEVIVQMVTQGPDDPMCCPTQRVVTRYALQDELVQVSSETLSGTSELVGITWEWVRFLGGDDSRIDVDDPSRYTLALNPDGTYQVRADCNRSGGAYTLANGSLELEPGPTTLAECEPGSLYGDFLAKLGNVRTYVMDGDKLVLDLWADAGQMVFRNAEQALTVLPLEGSLWQLVEYAREGSLVSVLPDTEITAEFLGGQVAGSSGCNRYTASYTIAGESVAFGPAASTRMMCTLPDGIMEQEQGYLAILGAVNAYRISGDKLDLVDAGGALLATFVTSAAQRAE